MIDRYNTIYTEMLSQNPTDISTNTKVQSDVEALRLALIGELDAINLYNQMANATSNPKMAEVLKDIADEEKVHVGELQKLLDELDPNNKQKRQEGEKEVEND